jgi:hypothetical protein
MFFYGRLLPVVKTDLKNLFSRAFDDFVRPITNLLESLYLLVNLGWEPMLSTNVVRKNEFPPC